MSSNAFRFFCFIFRLVLLGNPIIQPDILFKGTFALDEL